MFFFLIHQILYAIKLISSIIFLIKASAYATVDGLLTSEIIDYNTAKMMEQHSRKMAWLDKEQLDVRERAVEVI